MITIKAGPSISESLTVTTADLLRPQTLAKRLSNRLEAALNRLRGACQVDIAVCRGGQLVQELNLPDVETSASRLHERLHLLGDIHPGDTLCISAQGDVIRRAAALEELTATREQTAWLAWPAAHA